MQANSIKCPSCQTAILLDDVIAAPLVAEAQRAARLEIESANQRAVNAETALKEGLAKLAEERATFNASVQEAVIAKQPELEARVRQQISAETSADLQAREDRNKDLEEKLRLSRQAELDALKAQQAAEDLVAQSSLEISRQVAAQTAAIREDADRVAQEAANQTIAQKDLLIKQFRDQADEWKRKAERGPQNVQGDILEFDLFDALCVQFEGDSIQRTKKGQPGGDVDHVVMNLIGNPAGRILWEVKNTDTWMPSWLTKAKQDRKAIPFARALQDQEQDSELLRCLDEQEPRS